MKRSWNVSEVEIIQVRTTREKYEQALDEWAKLIYDSLCQPETIQIEASEALTQLTLESEDADVA